ncbi:hypothetical protein K469DRAFT_724984 [Zopfia rhizophila CBS 207.26]|uniref:Cyclase n=1 Tax=Zopfia rhizophila CBS 207.26 TaxID=1314779 RepID=A0A6A6ECM9_9PEZI|nr:hypothetical protein K469DRAFT_724984 [Zopfia rhizophila CBS 207.26]
MGWHDISLIPPDFVALTIDLSGPQDNAWDLFGNEDELGMLNLLTPDPVAAAAKEIQTGVCISLDLPLNFSLYPCWEKKELARETSDDAARNVGGPMNDDIVTFNTQGSVPWDGYRHFVWLKNGGIQRRGILVDWADWASKKGIERPRKAYKGMNAEQQKTMSERRSPEFIGLEPGEESLKWIWDSRFAAVAGDSVGFEELPPSPKQLQSRRMPIGELFDLKELAEYYKRTGRYSFFPSTVPLKIQGGVASPPNAVAIF